MIVETDTMILFWMPDSIYSNFYPDARLILPQYPSIVFENSEAAFMYLKAMEFGDTVIADQILLDHAPKRVKALGKRVNGFDEEAWATVRYERMFDAVLAKFLMNPKLSREMVRSDKILVEASPVDRIWGIGLAPNDIRAQDVTNWNGLNLLGKVCMEVRDVLKVVYREAGLL